MNPPIPTATQRMYLQRLLQINLATLAGLATLLLSMGEDSPSEARCWSGWPPGPRSG